MTWPVSLFAIAVIAGLTILARQVIAASAKQLEKNACANTCTWTVIATKPLAVDNSVYPQTLVLRRCSKCGLHSVRGYPGEWGTEEFLKQQADSEWFKREVG